MEALRTTVLNDAVSAYEEGGDQNLRGYLESLDIRSTCGRTCSMNGAAKCRTEVLPIGQCGSQRAVRGLRTMDFFSPHPKFCAIRERRQMANIVTQWCWDCLLGREYSSAREGCRLPA